MDAKQLIHFPIFDGSIANNVDLTPSSIPWTQDDQVEYQGKPSIRAPFVQGQHFTIHFDNALNTARYQWLEFAVYTDRPDLLFQINIDARDWPTNEHTYNAQLLRSCGYFDGGTVAPEQWTRVRIPLSEFAASEVLLGNFVWYFTEENPQSFTIYLSDIKLTGVAQ